MKRISTWFLSTVTVVVLMFGYHTSTSSTLAGSTANQPVVSSGSTAGSTSGATSGASSGSGSGSGSGSTTTTKTKTPSPSGPSTVTGSVAQTQWGPVQVELTVSTAGQVTKVSVVQYPSGNGTDQQINSYALPVLIQETMDQQGAQIDMVSGATVTSVGYLQSLQSALDQAGL
ncbi:MAG: FMN-binding protein [Nocardioides sp.]